MGIATILKWGMLALKILPYAEKIIEIVKKSNGKSSSEKIDEAVKTSEEKVQSKNDEELSNIEEAKQVIKDNSQNLSSEDLSKEATSLRNIDKEG